MDGFKNSTRMKYMCGGPVKKATGGVMEAAAPKSMAKTAVTGKQLPTPEIASKRQVQPTPPKDVKTIGGAPKSAKTMGGEPRRSDEGISAKRLLAGTAGDYAAPPEKAKTIGGAPKAPKGVPVASNKPMIGLKGGGHVTKSMTKW